MPPTKMIEEDKAGRILRQRGQVCSAHSRTGSLVEVQDALPDRVHFRAKYLDSMDNPVYPWGTVGEVCSRS